MARYTSTKSQVWALDLIIAIVIFLGALMLFYKYSLNSIDIEKTDMGSLLLDAKLISTYLVSEGYPIDWQSAPNEVALIGLTNGEMDLNPGKVQGFSQLVASDYAKTRKLLSTTHDYYVFFEDKNNNTIKIQGVGENWIGKNYSNENPEDIIKTIRFVSYNSTIIRLVVYVW